MPPIPSLPDNIHTRTNYDEGCYRLSLLVAGADVESQCLGHSTLVWYVKDQPSPEASEEKRQVRTEMKCYELFPKSFQYECKIVSGGTIKYDGKRHPDYMAVSMGTKPNCNLLEMPAHPSTIVKSSVENLDPADWMRVIRQQHPGTYKLSSLTIPGTHNSFARVGSVEYPLLYEDLPREIAECQTYGIMDQLLMGVRYIDLRTSGTELRLRHGRVELKGDLRDALDTIAEFLKHHPDETVLVQAKRDMESLLGSRQDETAETRKAVEDAFSRYSCSYTETREPSLDECRGKMVLLSTNHATKGINLSPNRDGSPNINGDYKDMEQHWKDVKQRLEWNANNASTDDGFWYHCGCNSYWMPQGSLLTIVSDISKHNYLSPRDHASHLSWRMSEHIKNQYWDKPYRLGLVELDFAYPALVKQLLLTNFS